MKLPTLTPEFWATRVMQAVSAILGIAASFGLNLSSTEKAAILAVTVAFIPGLLEIGWLHFRGLLQSVVPASPTHVIVASPSSSGGTAVQAADAPATVVTHVGAADSVTVTRSGSGTSTA